MTFNKPALIPFLFPILLLSACSQPQPQPAPLPPLPITPIPVSLTQPCPVPAIPEKIDVARLMDIAFDALTSIQICNGRMAQVRGIEVDRQKSYELKFQEYNLKHVEVKAP